jgi:hypothetical protein
VNKTEVAELLALAAGSFNRRSTLALDSTLQAERCRRLNAYGILSVSALGAILNMSVYKVEKATIGQERPKARGHLNPKHLPMLGYMLSSGKVNKQWLKLMLDEGTSISTISDLTGISEATLYRRRND